MAGTKSMQVFILMGVVAACMAAGVYGEREVRGGVTEEKEETEEGGPRVEVEGGGKSLGGGGGGEKEGRAIAGAGGANTVPNISASSSVPPKCLLPKKMGVCRAFLPSYYYNPILGACDCFVYGGCRGNDNRFTTLDECMAECGVQQSAQQTTAECIKLFGETPKAPERSSHTNSKPGLSTGDGGAVLVQ